MSSPSEISALQKIMVKPMEWNINKIPPGENYPKGSYNLLFTYVSPDRGEYEFVRTRRGDIKKYKTLNALFSDITKVQQDAQIRYTE